MRKEHNILPVAVVLGLCPTGLAVVRSLGRRGIPVKCLDTNRWAIGFQSKYCRKLPTFNFEKDEKGILESLIRFGRSLSQKGVIFATSDDFLQFIARHEKELKPYYRYPNLNVQLMDLFLNKRKFYQACLEHNIPFPKTYYPACEKDVKSIGKKIEYPCIIKPIYTHVWAKIFKAAKARKVNSPEELMSNYKELGSLSLQNNLMVQEIVQGGDEQIYIFASYFDKKSNPLTIFTGRKIRQYPVGFGTTSSAEAIQEDEVAELSIRFLKAAKFHGLCDVEFKKDPKDGQFKMMEINPRAGRWYSLVERSGTNPVYLAYQDLTGKKVETGHYQKKSCKWIFLLRDVLSALTYTKRGELSLKQYLKSLRGTKEYAIYISDDPVPFLVFPFYLVLEMVDYIKEKKIKNSLPYILLVLRKEGIFNCLRLFMRKLFRWEKFIIFEKNLKESIPSAESRLNITVKEATAADIESLQNNANLYAIENFWNKFNDVKTCYFAYSNGKFVHLSWVFFENEGNKFIKPGPKEAVIGPCYTVPEMRGKGVYPKVIATICQELRKQDFEKVFMATSKRNHSSIRGIKKAGFEERGETTLVNVFGIKIPEGKCA